MATLDFKESKDYSLGLELEFQIVNPQTFNLVAKAKDLLRSVYETHFETRIKPEITQSMLELNTSIHTDAQSMLEELIEIRNFLLMLSDKYNILFCGGGTHPFQKWVYRKIFPTIRFRQLSRKYRYLVKRATVFGLHVHIGCADPEKAIYLTHILHRFVPQFIALSASSPFYEGVDTGFDSSRVTLFTSFPLSGIMPYSKDWQSFVDYFYKFKNLGLAESMKDFYWDIRPKPEFGTVEIRVLDTPLTFRKSVLIAAYIQSLACFILSEKTFPLIEDIYIFHNYNRFQAARHGLAANIIDPFTNQNKFLLDDIQETMQHIKPCSKKLGNDLFLKELQETIVRDKNDTALLREKFNECGNLKDVVKYQCEQWKI